MLVSGFLEDTAARRPGAVALVCGSRRLTYRQLDEAADRVASGLQSLGLRRGDRVLIHLENSVDTVLAIFGTLKAGGVFVLVNPTVKAEKLAYLLGDSGAVVIVSDPRARATVTEALAGSTSLNAVIMTGSGADTVLCGRRCVSLDSLIEREGTPATVHLIDEDLAAIIYTSGSTGFGKGVMLSHANILAAATSIEAYLGNTETDVILNVLPLSFDYGLYQIFLAFKAGARLVLERSFVYSALLLELMTRERVTALPIVPMIAALLVKHDLAACDLTALRYLTNTGAPLPPSHIATLRNQLPNVRIFSMYGLTECKRVSFLPPEDIDVRPTSVGKAMPNVEVYLVDEHNQRFDHGTGELVIRGANVMQGYWRLPEETDRVLKPGPVPGERVLYSGDIFSIDRDGYMYFQSRTDDIIKSRGQKVSPREVEGVLCGIPGVDEAAVVGVPEPILGEAIKAFVTLTGSHALNEQDILHQCAQRLEDFMVPRTVEIVDSLPRTGSGKVARQKLQAGAMAR